MDAYETTSFFSICLGIYRIWINLHVLFSLCPYIPRILKKIEVVFFLIFFFDRNAYDVTCFFFYALPYHVHWLVDFKVPTGSYDNAHMMSCAFVDFNKVRTGSEPGQNRVGTLPHHDHAICIGWLFYALPYHAMHWLTFFHLFIFYLFFWRQILTVSHFHIFCCCFFLDNYMFLIDFDVT